MKIKIFCEAGNLFGWGHLIRCKRLADLLGSYYSNIYLYCRGDYKDIPKFQNQISYREEINSEWFNIKFFEDKIKDSDVIIIDSYEASEVLYQIAFERSKLLIILDDNKRLNYPSKAIILNGALGAQFLYERSNRNLAGIEFAIVDSKFLFSKTAEKFVNNIFVSFGGSDVMGMVSKVAKILENSSHIVHIVLPKSQSLSKTPKRKIYQQLESIQMANLMKSCDIAISAGGGTLCELAMAQVPTLIIPTALNQEFQSRQWEETGAMKITNLKNLLRDIKVLEMQKIRQDMISKISNFSFGVKLLPKLKELFDQEGIGEKNCGDRG